MPKQRKQTFAEKLTGRSKAAEKRVTTTAQVKAAVGTPKKKRKESALRRFILNRTGARKITEAMDRR